jgi:hypothetical protein
MCSNPSQHLHLNIRATDIHLVIYNIR